MTDLVGLKQRVLDAMQEYALWGQANTYGQSAETLVTIDLGYRKAQRAYSEALRDYEAALREATE